MRTVTVLALATLATVGCDPAARTRITLRPAVPGTATRIDAVTHTQRVFEATERFLGHEGFSRSPDSYVPPRCERASSWHRASSEASVKFDTNAHVCKTASAVDVSFVDYFRFTLSESTRLLSDELRGLISQKIPGVTVTVK